MAVSLTVDREADAWAPLLPATKPAWLTERQWLIAVLRWREKRTFLDIGRIVSYRFATPGPMGLASSGGGVQTQLAAVRRKLLREQRLTRPPGDD